MNINEFKKVPKNISDEEIEVCIYEQKKIKAKQKSLATINSYEIGSFGKYRSIRITRTMKNYLLSVISTFEKNEEEKRFKPVLPVLQKDKKITIDEDFDC